MSTQSTTTQTVRWFAGAAHAAGVTEETIEVAEVAADQTVAAFLAAHRPGAVTVLERCSFLAAGKAVDRDAAWPREAAVIDVLPPFTGG